MSGRTGSSGARTAADSGASITATPAARRIRFIVTRPTESHHGIAPQSPDPLPFTSPPVYHLSSSPPGPGQ